MITNVLKTLGSLRATLVAAAGIPFLIAASAFAQNDLSSVPDTPVSWHRGHRGAHYRHRVIHPHRRDSDRVAR